LRRFDVDSRDEMTSILSYRRGEPASCAVYHLSKAEWSEWADRLYGGSVAKAKGLQARGPVLVASWLAIRAAAMGWMGLFRRWGKIAKRSGLSPDDLDTTTFQALYDSLCKEERFHSASVSFKREYEEVMGYPFRLKEAQ
jgi:hypothetical protein